MSYPNGCSQSNHDKAFDELGPKGEDRDFDPYEELEEEKE